MHFKFSQHPISFYSLIIISAIFFVVTQNIAFWQMFMAQMSFESWQDYLFTVTLFIVLICLLSILLTGLLWWRLAFPVLAILIIISTLFNYYSFHYHIFMDRDMITNVVETNSLEVIDLISFELFIWLLLGAVVPIFLLYQIRLKKTSCVQRLGQRMMIILGSVGIVVLVALGFYKDYASFFRNHREIIHLIMPSSYINGTISYLKKNYAANVPFQHVGMDAVLNKPNKEKTLLIMVVGETARSHNFSLNGYDKETNELLAKQSDLLSFQNVQSCGTATAISVPCMFSRLTHQTFDKIQAENQDNALDILQRAGYQVLWRENDHGCKGVCTRVPNEDVGKYASNTDQTAAFSYDETLLSHLDQYIESQKDKDNIVIVLHMNGSHGPTYFQRYPEKFKKFSPTCDTSRIETCSNDDLVRTYDNTVVYTDYILNQTIETLKKYDQYETAMLYVSDHGESLGESGFYLHGAPYAIAPKEQTSIPLIFWGNHNFYQNRQIDFKCMQKLAKHNHYTHDNIFHTLLGLLYVQTEAYNAELNLFKGC